jgi:PAS domain S-box-containing protein
VDGDTLYMRLQRLTPTHAVEEWETTLHPSTTRTVPVTVRINPVVDRSGVVTGLRWLVRDNGPRQRAATALWQERNFISAVLDTTAALIAVLDTRGYIVRFNRACERVTGYTFAEVSNAPFWEILLRPDETAGVKEVFSNLMAGHFPNQHENCWTTKDGRQRLIRWSNTVLHDVDGAIEYIVATGVDITDQRAAEEQARRQQQALTHSMRVSTIGEMASGLAHEINQPLTAIASYAQGCLHRVESGDTALRPLVDTVRHIATQAQRAATIVQHLRYFVAKAEPHRVDTDLNGLIRDAVSFARTESAHGGCDVSLELGSIPPVVVDDIQIQQVVLNLLRNAFDSLAGTPQGQRRVQVRTLLNNQQEAETIVSDNGPGLPPEAAARLFEPFYTTKPQGMGLGLAICRTIIEDHGGRLWVVPGGTVGADFHFTLPLSNGNHGA